MSVACNDLELTEIPTILSSESVISFEASNNILTHIKEYVFKDYGSLETLNLSESGIEQIDSSAFYGLKMLLNIDLSYNNLRFITPTMFSDTPVLQTVSFRGNPLDYVPDSSPIFVSTSITSLDLSYCDLTSVNIHTFSQLPGLQVLDLYSNKLREFNRDILNTLTEISVIDFGNNLWKCDCNIVEVLNCLSDRRSSKGLLREHKPVKCVDAGVRKTIWSPASKNELCSEHAELLPKTSTLKEPPASLETTTDAKLSTHSPTSLETTRDAKVSTHSPTSLETTTDAKGLTHSPTTSTLGSGVDDLLSLNNILLVFVILPVMLAVTTFITLVSVHFVTNLKRFRMIEEVSSDWKKGVGKNKDIFSREPLNSSTGSSELFIENHGSAFGSSIIRGSYISDSYHLYERIE
jgi:hypothetical protein